jgi:glycosyltransferase involved in cell wall biosynthesis
MKSITVGLLGGDVPWEAPPPRGGKLLSAGVTARNESRAYRLRGPILPYTPLSPDTPEPERRTALAAFLSSIDVLSASVYPWDSLALQVRHEQNLPCPVILHAYGAMPKAAEAMLFPWQDWLRPGDGMLFNCRADRVLWRRLVRKSALHEWIVPLPVDETLFYPRPMAERRAMRAKLDVPPDAPLLLYVGRLNIQKNLHTLFRIFAAVRREIPEAILCLVGAEDEIVFGEFDVRNTGYAAYLRRFAEELGITEALRWTGLLFGEDLAQAYAAADVLVNAGIYHRENFGLSQAEAQSCGLPVVCTHWGGFKEVVLPGETGCFMPTILTKKGIRVDWAVGVRQILALLQDADLRRKMGARAVERARATFSVAAVSRALAQVVAEATAPLPESVRHTRAYQTSAFARRYEAHKRACGWYAAANPQQTLAWYPAKFQGRDYALYETMMQPYATSLAQELPPDALQPQWIPYAPSTLEFDPIRRLVRCLDPIWPQQRFLTTLEWEALYRVDGKGSVHQIAGKISEGKPEAESLRALMPALWSFYREGLLLFRREDEPETRL